MLRIFFLLALVALALYFVFWVTTRGNGTPEVAGNAPRRPMGPDDDEDFLRQLDREKWRKKRLEDLAQEKPASDQPKPDRDAEATDPEPGDGPGPESGGDPGGDSGPDKS